MAERVLDEVSTDVPAEGWIFNKEPGYPLHPDAATNTISIPDNILRADAPQGVMMDVVIRQGKLYDRIVHTYQWSCTQYMDVTWLLTWEDLWQW